MPSPQSELAGNSRTRVRRALIPSIALALQLSLAIAAQDASAQSTTTTTTTTTQPSVGSTAKTSPASRAAASGAAKIAKVETKPLWSELTPAQQQSLAPLAGAWPQISEAQKRKWLVISKNYPALPPAEQSTMRSRMMEWVALSAQQRSQARLNFAEAKQLAPDDKKARWEAYNALPPDEKRKLAAGAGGAGGAANAPSTAAAVKPVPAQKLANIPKSGDSKGPRIATAPGASEQSVLLPPQAPVAPAVTGN